MRVTPLVLLDWMRPAAIDDLEILTVNDLNVLLGWTSVGDDSHVGAGEWTILFGVQTGRFT